MQRMCFVLGLLSACVSACGAEQRIVDGSIVDQFVPEDAPLRDSVFDAQEQSDAVMVDGLVADENVSPDVSVMVDVVVAENNVSLDAPVMVDVSAPEVSRSDSAPDVTVDASSGCSVPTVERATWVVSAEPAVTPSLQTELFAMLSQRRVTRVYIDVGRLLDSTSGRTALANYVRAFRQRCIAVELLFGNRYRVDMPMAVMERANAAIAYVQSNPTAVPEALHFDLEPHVFPGFGSDAMTFSTVAEQYVSLLDRLGPLVRGAGMRLHVDIAHWYWTRMFTRAGRTASLDTWVAERVDGFSIMDYWGQADYAATRTRIVNQTREVETARVAGVRAWVGLQVTCGGPPDETLCEEGSAFTERLVTDVSGALSANRAYAGVAFYDHAGLGSLRP